MSEAKITNEEVIKKLIELGITLTEFKANQHGFPDGFNRCRCYNCRAYQEYIDLQKQYKV